MLRLIIMPIVAGFIATLGITGVLWGINRTGWTNADMVRAVGSFFTKSYENALGAGLVIHFINGIVFAALYLHILSLMGLEDLGAEILMGGAIGLGQGFLVGWAIVRFAEWHPIEQFQKADYQVAIAHIVGHVVYGLLIGVVFGLMRIAGFDVSPGF